MAAPEWAKSFIGIPFKSRGRDRSGADCYQLVRMVSALVFNVELPDYDYVAAGDRHANGELVKVFASGEEWTKVPWDERQAGDVVVIKVFSEPSHVGIVLDRDFFLSTREGTDSTLGRFHSPAYERRIDGIYRYNFA